MLGGQGAKLGASGTAALRHPGADLWWGPHRIDRGDCAGCRLCDPGPPQRPARGPLRGGGIYGGGGGDVRLFLPDLDGRRPAAPGTAQPALVLCAGAGKVGALNAPVSFPAALPRRALALLSALLWFSLCTATRCTADD